LLKRLLSILVSIGTCALCYVHAQPLPDSADVTLTFSWQNHYAQTVFGTPLYRNVRGQQYAIDALRYYIHNVTLQRSDGRVFVRKMPILIDHEEEASTLIVLDNVPSGTYTSVSFVIGVDSTDNVAGPREGALDPLNGMYWTWSTGYIFFKLEGTSPASTQPKNMIEYHLGGFQAPYINMQRVDLSLRKPLQVGADRVSLGIVFDVGVFIDADGGIDFSAVPSITDVRSAGPYMKRLQGAFHVR